jgi:hypothetical protein
MVHQVLLFLHVTSAMGIVAGLGIEGLVLLQLRAAETAADARLALTNSRYVQRVGGISMLAALVTGIYLATAYWQWRGAWMGVAFLTIILLAVVGGLMTGRPTMRVLRAAPGALDSAELARVQRSLGRSYMLRLWLFLGIVFLMTTKPTAGPMALLVVVVAAVLGLIAGLPARRARRPVHA